MIVYGVHITEWSSVSEILLLTADLAKAEGYAQQRATEDLYGAMVVVTNRELDQPGEVRVMSVWAKGRKIADHGPRGMWRKVQENAF